MGSMNLTSVERYVDRLCQAYRADYAYLAVIRIAFAFYILLRPIDYQWVGAIPPSLFQPAPGPFSLMAAPPLESFLDALEVARFIFALVLIIGFRTVECSVLLAVVLLLGGGLTNSFGKVDHFILFEILPLAMAAAGWGRALSIDAVLTRRTGRDASLDNGLPLLCWAMIVAFALFTAAIPKALRGWLDPSREATRAFLAIDIVDADKLGPFAQQIASIDSAAFWKVLDYSTILAEGSLVVLVLFPMLFRIGIMVMLFFHLGVYLTLGIAFDSYIFVYLPFFAAPFMSCWRRLSLGGYAPKAASEDLRRRKLYRGGT